MSDTESNELPFIDSMRLNGEVDLMLKESIRQENLEFEWIYGDPSYPDKRSLTKELFVHLKHKLDESTQYTSSDETNSLDIRCEFINKGKSVMSNIRATISGIHQVKQYCLHDTVDDLDVLYISKTRYKDPRNRSIDYSSASSGMYPCRINLKQEVLVDPESKQVDIFLKNWSSKNKFFRYKKRYSYLSLNKLWRIDLTALKSSGTGGYLGQYTYSKSFRKSNVLNNKETFELEIEYVGSVSEGFSPAPISTYADIMNINPFAFTTEEPVGNVFTGDISFTGNEETQDLYTMDSPRYDDGIEFDEPGGYPLDSPRQVSDVIKIKDEYWKDSKQEELFKLIKKGVEVEEWVHQDYKFIPRQKRYIHRLDADLKKGDYLEVEISPHVAMEDETVQTLMVPMKYIIDDISSYDLPEEYSPASPRGRDGDGDGDEGQKGGGFAGFAISSTCYSTSVINGLLEGLEQIIHFCYSIIVGSEYYLDAMEESSIVREYIELSDPTGMYHKNGWKLVGPQPISMGIQHLNPLNAHSVVSKYVVTEKADGIRAQLLVSNDSRGYLITSKKEVIDTGVNFGGIENSWIFDGEYITQNKNKEPIQLFMIFDVYYSSDSTQKQPHTFPWLHKKGKSRSEIIYKFKQAMEIRIDAKFPDSGIRIGFKQYLEGPEKLTKKKGSTQYSNIQGMFRSAKKILDLELRKDGYEYFTDGLIFLPMYLPVKGSEEGDIVKSIKGTWNYNYKWKPPEENTIDFKVIYCKEKNKPVIHSYNHESVDGRTETRFYQKVQLAVQYKEQDDDTIDFNLAQLMDKPLNKQPYQYFDPPTHPKANIHLTNIPLHNKRMKCLKDNKDLLNGSIIEMKYNPDSDNGFTWTPLRVRDDKDKPQYFTIANNIWTTINDPVTESMIRGNINFDEIGETVVSDKYYVDTKFAEDGPIRSLHNYIKSKLISRIGSSVDHRGPLMIADLSCGRGGDIKKYLSIRNPIEFILGLDISGNINEAAQRYHYLPKPKPKALFLQFDTSLSIETKVGCLGSTEEKKEVCETMIDMILGQSKSYHKQYKDIQKKYVGLAKGGFHMVSSQFSLHYYFKDEATLRGLCENIQYLCSDDGYFIGTCYDGMKLMKTFALKDTDTLEMIDDSGSLIYQIKKKYSITDFSYDKDNLEDMFGQEIDVFMASIGQPITEYLVNFEFFIDLMEEYGFEPVLPTFKKGEYNPIKTPIQSFDTIIENTSEIKEKDNKFVKKTYNTDLYKVHSSKGYSLLSGLNNLFVFQKK